MEQEFTEPLWSCSASSVSAGGNIGTRTESALGCKETKLCFFALLCKELKVFVQTEGGVTTEQERY
ncbi:hypothetical protein SADUNF_Sadunf03G0114800 [Salix dunnii]|uniref:Uncharacterized protein n=1 Tax=Salix dunnii TaxID=1413687 RepID=A0A835N4C3_9ROSI|nr:hypothetical protein SADUNF_Sadunf03G0114800 [Salix dunnii]